MRALLALIAISLAAVPARADQRPVATRRLMRELVAGTAAWPIDAGGVAYIGYRSGESDPPDQTWTRKLCPAEARYFLRKQRHQLARRIADDENFRCSNQGDKPTCWIGDVGEFAGTLRFELRIEGDRLVLDTIAAINSVYPPDDQERVLDRLRARAAVATCAP
jgi:hypothetical protein